jgi:hypothetical protein
VAVQNRVAVSAVRDPAVALLDVPAGTDAEERRAGEGRIERQQQTERSYMTETQAVLSILIFMILYNVCLLPA